MKGYSLQFWLLCISSFLFFSSFNMIIPELPQFLSELGGGDYKGLIIALFTLTAGISRPFSGKLTDRVGRIPVMIFGVVVCFVVGFLYPLVTSVFWFMALRMLHGFSTGFKPTGTTAYAADIIPNDKRGEAMGVLGFFGNTGMAFGPMVGGLMVQFFSRSSMFYASSVLAVLSVLILIGMKETLQKPEKLKLSHFKVHKGEIFDPAVIPAGIVMLLTVFTFGVALTIVPDYSVMLGISNKGMFFAVYTISSLLSRLIAGRLSDRFGRVPLLIAGCLFSVIACLGLAFAADLLQFYVASLLFGVAAGTCSPTIFAWTIDLGDHMRKGRALATLFIALEIGVGSGALLAGWLYADNLANIPLVFSVAACFPLLAFFYLLRYRWQQKYRLAST